MGILKNLRALRKGVKDLRRATEESGVDTSLSGLLSQAPGMLAQASEAVRDAAEGRAEGERLQREGIPAIARIVAVRDTGMSIGGTALGAPAQDNPVAEIDVQVRFEGGDPYPATVRQMVPRLAVGRLIPGHEVAARVDRRDRFNVLLDWEAPIPPAP